MFRGRMIRGNQAVCDYMIRDILYLRFDESS